MERDEALQAAQWVTAFNPTVRTAVRPVSAHRRDSYVVIVGENLMLRYGWEVIALMLRGMPDPVDVTLWRYSMGTGSPVVSE